MMATEAGTVTEQYGFSYDADLCVECRACELACKGTNDLEPGIRWRKVTEEWRGRYPDLKRVFLSSTCRHCPKPACAAACPTGALSKRAEDGIVVVDLEKCDGCGDCLPACPYGVPQFGTDGKMQKCDYCLSVGVEPVCARSCPSGALTFGLVDGT
jgi:anaerobic dimethyl sulfoxide reductase subunit B (iron-sulfur subunit)